MRKIKFRGKRVDNGEWIYGFLIEYASGNLKITIPECRKDLQKKSNIIYGTYTIIPETIGQYTGLKDKNGVEIYEGDILKIEYETDKFVKGEVFYDCQYGVYSILFKKEIDDKPKDIIGIYNQVSEVIGTIHDKKI